MFPSLVAAPSSWCQYAMSRTYDAESGRMGRIRAYVYVGILELFGTTAGATAFNVALKSSTQQAEPGAPALARASPQGGR